MAWYSSRRLFGQGTRALMAAVKGSSATATAADTAIKPLSDNWKSVPVSPVLASIQNPSKKTEMTGYLSRSFRRSNSSLFLCSGKAVQSSVVRITKERFLVDTGLGTARICKQDELTSVPIKHKRKRATRFENKVGFTDVVGCELRCESRIKKIMLMRLFRSIVSGESRKKKQAAAMFHNLAGSTDVVAGEGHFLLPQSFRQKRALMELKKIWQTNGKVKGFFLNNQNINRRQNYVIAIAGFIASLPKNLQTRRVLKSVGGLSKARFTIRSLRRRRKNLVIKNIEVSI